MRFQRARRYDAYFLGRLLLFESLQHLFFCVLNISNIRQPIRISLLENLISDVWYTVHGGKESMTDDFLLLHVVKDF